MKPENATVTKYWLEFYVQDGHCSLCGNRGSIDTRSATTHAGSHVGRRNWCICPNGQRLRRVLHPRQPDEAINEPADSAG